MAAIPVVSVVGYSGSGKTTFLEKLIRELKDRNIKVGIIKHHVHNIEIDTPGKDTWRHSRAGADVVAISTPGRVGLFRKLEREMNLEELAAMMGEADIILTEGYKRGSRPKIEVNRSQHSKNLITGGSDLIAVVSDVRWNLEVPVFDLEDYKGVADFLQLKYKLRPR